MELKQAKLEDTKEEQHHVVTYTSGKDKRWVCREDLALMVTVAATAVGLSGRSGDSCAEKVWRSLCSQDGVLTESALSAMVLGSLDLTAADKVDRACAAVRIAGLLVESRFPLLVLLSGTSGSGKSSLASLVARRLGISTVISTDSIRQQLRFSRRKSECPELFVSTYETDKVVTEQKDESGKLIQGFLKQADLVMHHVPEIVRRKMQALCPMVLEGVHLTAHHCETLVNGLQQLNVHCVAFNIYIDDEKMHLQRFAGRTPGNSLDPAANKYVKNFDNIRHIQKFLLDECKRAKIKFRAICNIYVHESVDEIVNSVWDSLLSQYRSYP